MKNKCKGPGAGDNLEGLIIAGRALSVECKLSREDAGPGAKDTGRDRLPV